MHGATQKHLQMQTLRLGRTLAFIAGSIVGGLALAFIIVLIRPELLGRASGAAQAPAEARLPATARVTYADAVQRAAPAVVNIYTARLVTEQVAPNRLDRLFGELWPRYRQRIERSLGSGVIVDVRGHIVTNHHVIANADSIRVQLADGRIGDATIVGRDPDTDLAVLQTGLEPLPVMPLGRSDRLKVGDVVLAIGNPLGLSQSVTHGIVSATGRGQLGVAQFENFIQTDAPINFGNSGGALVDASGDLVGINTAIVAKNLGVEGIGFAIPVNLVRGVLAEIISQGRVIRGWVGIVPEDLSDAQAARLGAEKGGVLIRDLYVRSPALESGLRLGDVVTAIDGTPVRGSQEVIARIATRKPGETLKLQGVRRGEAFEVEMRVSERPPDF
jgi:serine peptidase DegS